MENFQFKSQFSRKDDIKISVRKGSTRLKGMKEKPIVRVYVKWNTDDTQIKILWTWGEDLKLDTRIFMQVRCPSLFQLEQKWGLMSFDESQTEQKRITISD